MASVSDLPKIDLTKLPPSVIYVCVASADAVKYDGLFGINVLCDDFLQKVAELHVIAPQHVYISPSIANYMILPYIDRGSEYAHWKDSCRLLMPRCDIALVIDWPNAEKSIGVADEIQFMQEQGKAVFKLGVEECM